MRRLETIFALASAAALSLTTAALLAQTAAPPAPTAGALPPGHPPTGAAPTAARPLTGDALPPGHPPTGAAPTAARPLTGDELPPGHPPTGDALPEGHPPTDDELPAGHPSVNQGASPHGGTGRNPSGFFEPPPDGSGDDPTLPPGTLVIRIADADDAPIAGATIALGILRNTVAKGESRERVERVADAEGLVRFDKLEVGSGVSYRVTTTRGEAVYGVPPFTLSDAAGKRAALHSYEVTSDVSQALIGIQAIVYLSLKEDAMQIEQLFNVFNVGPVTWVPDGVVVRLPEGFKAFNKPEAMDDTRFDEVDGKGAQLKGTYKPGQASLNYRFQVPLSGDERQKFEIEFPPHVAQVRVMAEASRSMTLDVAGFPGAEKSQNRDGKRILITERQVARNEGGLKVLEITVAGLPTPGPGRWIAVGLGSLAIVMAAAYIVKRRDDTDLADDARDDLIEAKDALLDEIVALEKANARGELGPKSYARIRAALVSALARIVRKLEGQPEGEGSSEGATT